MFKTFKEWLVDKGITEDDFTSKEPKEMASLQKEYMNYVSEAIKENAPTKEQVTKLETELKNLEGAEKNEVTKSDFEALQEEVNQLKEKNDKSNKDQETVLDQFKAKKEEIQKIANGSAGEVVIKAVANRAIVANSPAGFVLPDIGQLGVKERTLYNALPKINVGEGNHTGKVRYRDWDEASITRAAAMVAEGGTFPESTAAFQWYTKDLRKIGDTLPVTEEFFEDEAQASGELERFININVELKVDEQLINGDNTGQNLDGIINHVPAYTAAASGIAAANLKDLVIKVRNSITRTRGSKYNPDMVLVASSTMEDLVLAKDANNNYIFDENTGTLGGLSVVVDENMPDNQIVVGDRRYATIYEMSGVVLSRGYIGSQFVEDEMTLKARKRLLLLIREVDKTGFLKVTDVDAALTTLAT